MQFLVSILFFVQLASAIAMIGLILVQHGKGADMGAAFGSGSSGSLFGASGSANFLSRATGVLAAVFFVCTLGLAFTSGVKPSGSSSVLEKAVSAPASGASAAAPVPAAPASGAQAVPTAPSAPAAPSTPAPAAPASTPASK
jgi:preprotein translocase subunit SecG